MANCKQLFDQSEKLEKQQEIAYVRKEKQIDDETSKKLEEVYGRANRRHNDGGYGSRRRGWKCPACYYINFDSRNVCGECLEKNPAALMRRAANTNVNEGTAAAATTTTSSSGATAGGKQQGQQQSFSPLEKRPPNEKLPGVSHDTHVKIITHDDRCYRVFGAALQVPSLTGKPGVTVETAGSKGGTPPPEGGGHIPSYQDDDAWEDGEDGEECDGDGEEGGPKIEFNPTTQEYSMKLYLPPRFYKFLIGAKGATLQETQRLTGATVTIPRGAPGKGGDEHEKEIRATTSSSSTTTTSSSAAAANKNHNQQQQHDKPEPILIRALDKNAIRAAHIRIDSIMMQCKDKVDYTHFLSIPLGVIPSLQGPLFSLISDMTSAACDPQARVEPSIFQNPRKVHLTLLMLRLYTAEEINTAKQILASLQSELNQIFQSGSDSKITIKGLNYMNDDPRDVHVVYLELEKDETYGKLANLIAKINQCFVDAGIAFEKDISHNEKLHATVINSKWRSPQGTSGDGGGANPGSGPGNSTDTNPSRLSFDARNVFKLFGQVCLGTHKLKRVDLSILAPRNTSYTHGDGSTEGYYANEMSIFFPQEEVHTLKIGQVGGML